MPRGPRPNAAPGTLSHLSYSSYSTGLECLKQFQLTRIQKAPEQQAWWFVGGNAVHRVTELYDLEMVGLGTKPRPWSYRMLQTAWQQAFEEFTEKAKAVEPDESKWKTGKERYHVWKPMGPHLVQAYIDWRTRSAWEIWITPDGEPAIELDVSGYLPGCSMKVLAYIDRIMLDPAFNKLHVVDIKSGKTKPDSPLQFGVYAALTEIHTGYHPDQGEAFMARDSSLHKPWPLAKWTPQYTGAQLGRLEQIVKAGAFTAHLGGHCWMCGVKDACYAYDGELSSRYDPDDPAYQPPF